MSTVAAPLRGPHPSPQQYLNPSMPNVAATASALGVPQSAAPPNTAGTVAVTGAQIPYQHPALAAAASNASSGGTNGNATNSGLMQPQPVFPYPQHAIFGGAGNPGMYGAQAIPGAAAAASGGANVGGPPPGGLISITPQGATGASGPMAANQAQLQGGNAPPYLHPNATGHMYPQSLSQSLYPAHVSFVTFTALDIILSIWINKNNNNDYDDDVFDEVSSSYDKVISFAFH